MKTLWSKTVTAILILCTCQSFGTTEGRLKGKMNYGGYETVQSPKESQRFSPQDRAILNLFKEFMATRKNKLPTDDMNPNENESIPETFQKKQEETKPKTKNAGGLLFSSPLMKAFTNPEDQSMEIDFEIEMPETPKKSTKPKETKPSPSIFSLVDKNRQRFFNDANEKEKESLPLMDLFFPSKNTFTSKLIKRTENQPEIKKSKDDCSDVTCTPPPSDSNCEKANLKESSKFSDLEKCCPLWICTKDDGSVYTHYGMSKISSTVNKQGNGMKSSFFQRSSSSSHSSVRELPKVKKSESTLDLTNRRNNPMGGPFTNSKFPLSDLFSMVPFPFPNLDSKLVQNENIPNLFLSLVEIFKTQIHCPTYFVA